MQKTTDEILLEIMIELDGRASAPISQMKKKLLVLSTPRSGSTLFCDVLNKIGVLGECREWLNLRYVEAYRILKKLETVDIGQYLEFIISKTLGEQNTFVVNMHIDQIQPLLDLKIDPFVLGFDDQIYLCRNNKVDQAVSLAKAMKTDQWSADTASKVASSPHPSFVEIAQSLHFLLSSEQIYTNNLKATTKLEFSYEDFSQLDKTKAFSNLYSALGLEVQPNPSTELRVQSDKSSVDLAALFLEHISGQNSGV
jgi:LPS sulfotransferase NodH